MNAENERTVDLLKKRFESFQNSKKPGHGLDDRRHDKNVNKRNIKRTPAFRRDGNFSRKHVDPSHSQMVTNNNNTKQSNNSNSNSSECIKTTQIDSHCYKTDKLNQKLPLDQFPKKFKSKFSADHKNLIECSKKKLENVEDISFKPKKDEKSENPLKTPLPCGPPPKKPPRTFAHDKQTDSDHSFKTTMESHNKFKADTNIMLQKLEQFMAENSFTYNMKDEKTIEQDNTKKKSNKSNLCNLTKALNCIENQNVYDNSLKTYNTDEQNYLTTKSIYQNDSEHIYDEPIFLNDNSRLNNNSDNCRTLIGHEWVCGSDKSNLHYMSTPITDINSKNNLNESEILKTDAIDSKSKKMTISHERKIQILMNEAYGTCIQAQDASDSESVLESNTEDSSIGSLNNLADKNICEQTLERKKYLGRVAKKSTTHSTTVEDKNHLFQALLLIGLDLSSNKEKLPYIKYKYPVKAKIPKQIEKLCFPDAHVWPFTANDCRSYSLTVTDENGRRFYGYCYRVQPEGAAYCLPLVYCIYSSVKANSFYFRILHEIESRHGLSEFNMNSFIGLLYSQPFPEPGAIIHLSYDSISSCSEFSAEDKLQRPLDIRQEQDDLLKLLSIIKPNTFIQMLATMLLERKLILLSKSISMLSSSIEGLTAALYPFVWQHTLVSVLPSQMISVADFVQAPTPYIIGLLKTENQSDIFSQFSGKDQVFIYDLDIQKSIRKVKDEYSAIPSRIAKGLKNLMGIKVELDHSTKAVLASESLIRLFIELIGHYRTFIVPNSESKQYHFQKQLFINAGTNTAHRNFLEWFTETTMFTTFINDKMQENMDNKDVFDCRCSEFSLEFKTKNKSKPMSIKALSDHIKNWTV